MTYPFTIVPLPYDYCALLPYLEQEILHFHHDKHYAAYVEKLNSILKDYPELQSMTLEELLINTDKLPDAVKTSIKNNAGGVYNHILYFACMNTAECEMPDGALANAIQGAFGSMDQFREQLSAAAVNQFGSGYAWLILSSGKLEIIATPNQDTPISDKVIPLLCIDV